MMLTILLVVGAVYAVLMAHNMYTARYYKGHHLPPPVQGFVPLGIDLLLRRIFRNDEKNLEEMVENNRKRGPLTNISMLGQRIVILNDPEALTHVLAKNFENYPKGKEQAEVFHEFLGQGIFASDDDAWKDQRAIAKNHFLRDDLGEMIPVFMKHSHEVVEILREHTVSGQPIDLQDLFLRFTMDAAGEILFNHDFGTIKKPSPFANSFDAVQVGILDRFKNPAWRVVEKIFGHDTFDRHIETITTICNDIVEKALSDPNIEERTDLLAHFIKSKAVPGKEADSIKYLRDMCMNFMIAGRDTTGVLLSWCILMIADHPEVEQKLVQEIQDVVGMDHDPTADDIRNLKYMKIFIYEVLRLYPSVPGDSRTAKEDDFLPSGHIVPKGAVVGWSQYVMSRNVKLFGKDAGEFNPDRWGPERVNEIRPFYWIPFHAGPRTCLGMNMAQNEAKVMLTLLLQRFRFQKASNHKITMKRAIILSSSTGNHMNVLKR